MTNTTSTHVYDVASWKPVTPEQYLSSLGEASMTVGEPSYLNTTVEDVNGRIRIVVHAEVTTRDDDGAPQSMVEPYLMTLFCAETGKTHSFVRQVDLAHQ